jgi:hypothetical protein
MSSLPIEEEDLDLDDEVYDPGLLDLVHDIENCYF